MDSKDNIPEDNIIRVTKQPDEPSPKPDEPSPKTDEPSPKKQKKPGRVAWGNKLAELAKKHKLEKNLDVPQRNSNILTWTAIGSLVIALTALYYQMKSTNIKKTTNDVVETPIFEML